MTQTPRLRCRLAFGVSAAALLSLAGPALAQEPPTPGQAPSSANVVAEVVVTAEKREESLQDVPVAISAFTDEKRDLIGITTIQDMTNFTPGLQYSTQTDRTSLRGIGRLTNVRTAEGGVAIYSDGIYTTSTVEAGRTPLFIDRVEVLRGPQGTLYGRNSISGAINVISKRPTEDWYAEVRGLVANYDRTLVEGAVSGPTPIPDLTFRLVGQWEQQDEGWYKNNVPGMPSEGNVIDTTIFEGQLLWEPRDWFDVWVKFSNYDWDNGGGGPGARNQWTPTAYPTYQYQNSGITTNPGYACRPGTGVTNVVNNSPTGCRNPELDDERTFASNIPYEVTLKDTYIFATEVNLRTDWGFDLKYLGGAVNYHYFLEGPVFFAGGASPPISQYTLPTVLGTPGQTINPNYPFLYEEDINWQSHEINLASNTDGALQWLAGIYYFDEDDEQPVSTYLPEQPEAGAFFPALGPGYCFLTGGVCAPQQLNRVIYDSRPEGHIESKAIYGQIDWAFAEQWSLTAGLRYTDDSKKGSEEVRVNCYAVAACLLPPETSFLAFTFVPLVDVTQFPTVTSQPGTALPPGVTGPTTFSPVTGRARREFNQDWQATTGTLGVQWQPNNDTNVYARYSRGFKAGGFRVGIDTAITRTPVTDPEYADAYEIGAKVTLLDGRLQMNTAVFRTDYENAQVPVSVISTSGGLSTTQAIFFNVDESVTQGLEFEATWLPLDDLQLLFNYSYLDTEITQGQIVDPADPAALLPGASPLFTFAQCAEVVPGSQRVPPSTTDGTRCELDVFTGPTGDGTGGFQRLQDLSGNRLPNAPEHKVALNANYTWMTDFGEFIGSASYIWRDEQFGSIFSRDVWKSPAYDQVDARLTWRAPGDRFTAIIYGRNLFDDIGYEGGAFAVRKVGFVPVGPAATTTPVNEGIASIYPITPPRTFGIELQYKFF